MNSISFCYPGFNIMAANPPHPLNNPPLLKRRGGEKYKRGEASLVRPFW